MDTTRVRQTTTVVWDDRPVSAQVSPEGIPLEGAVLGDDASVVIEDGVVTRRVRRPLDLAESIAHALESVEQQARARHVSIQTALQDDDVTVSGDPLRVQQVLVNLLTNALKYTPAGQVTLHLAAAGTDAQGRVPLAITVQDSGVGIDPDELPLIFDRFHRADKSRNTATGESGLGLAIVKALVEAHGGRIGAESQPGRGTTITIDLPRA